MHSCAALWDWKRSGLRSPIFWVIKAQEEVKIPRYAKILKFFCYPGNFTLTPGFESKMEMV